MPPSLKALTPALGRAFGVPPGAIYERIRALMRAELIETIPGRGPGAGARATPRSMALLLISLLVSESLTETIRLTRMVMDLRSVQGERFVDALESFLASPEKADRVTLISIMRARAKLAQAVIHYLDEKGDAEDIFGADELDILGQQYSTASVINIRLGDIARDLE